VKNDPLHHSKRCREDLYNYLSNLFAFQVYNAENEMG